MKKDIETQAFVSYVGSYEIDSTYHFTFSLSELWLDLHAVTIEDETEPLWFDMSSQFDTELKGTGTVVYGKNSRYAVIIKNND